MDGMDRVYAAAIAAEASTWAIGGHADADRRLFSGRRTSPDDLANMCAEAIAAAKATLQRRTAAAAAARPPEPAAAATPYEEATTEVGGEIWLCSCAVSVYHDPSFL